MKCYDCGQESVLVKGESCITCSVCGCVEFEKTLFGNLREIKYELPRVIHVVKEFLKRRTNR